MFWSICLPFSLKRKLDVWSEECVYFVLDPSWWRWRRMCDICDARRRPHTWKLSAIHDNEEVSVFSAFIPNKLLLKANSHLCLTSFKECVIKYRMKCRYFPPLDMMWMLTKWKISMVSFFFPVNWQSGCWLLWLHHHTSIWEQNQLSDTDSRWDI